MVILAQIEYRINLERIKDFLLTFPREIYQVYQRELFLWYRQRYMPTLQEQIKTGQGRFPRYNIEPYRTRKLREYGISHSLGLRTGKLSREIDDATPTVTRLGTTVVFRVEHRKPFYLGRLLRGGGGAQAYNVVESAFTKEFPKLRRRIDKSIQVIMSR